MIGKELMKYHVDKVEEEEEEANDSSEITYDYEEENCFDGGNEYRFFDFQSLRYLSERLANISFENDTNKVTLRT
ncbi:DUF5103 domain-containing protein [bacterium]|nr:DUF5103 domain-containing protein [bacterium]